MVFCSGKTVQSFRKNERMIKEKGVTENEKINSIDINVFHAVVDRL